MGEDTLALEVAPGGAISFTKGCYIGQEVVARGTYRGHMNRRLMGLRIDGDVPPQRGDPVRTAEKVVGHVTSGAWSPTLRSVIALAILRIEEVSPTTPLSVDRGGWDLRASVVSLPFVRPRG
jgi:folate-binding protein YgfZ